MKAAVLTTYGDPATGLEYRDMPEPGKPGVGQVLVALNSHPLISATFLSHEDSTHFARICPQ